QTLPGKNRLTLVGESHFADAFISPDTGRPVGRVFLGKTMDEWFSKKLSYGETLYKLRGPNAVAASALPGKTLDLKTQYPGHGSYHGMLLQGRYMTLREAGNALLGAIVGKTGMPFEDFQKAAGALHQGGVPGVLWRGLTGKTYGSAPAYGEINYQFKR